MVDPRDRLWVLDTGSIQFAPTTYGGPKLVGIDLGRNQTFKKILFPSGVALPTSYLNDVRFDFSRGGDGFAYITDSGQQSPNGIIVVDLSSGKSRRVLSGHASVKPDRAFIPVVEGQQVWNVAPTGKKSKWAMGSDGIAIDPVRRLLYYCPLSSRICSFRAGICSVSIWETRAEHRTDWSQTRLGECTPRTMNTAWSGGGIPTAAGRRWSRTSGCSGRTPCPSPTGISTSPATSCTGRNSSTAERIRLKKRPASATRSPRSKSRGKCRRVAKSTWRPSRITARNRIAGPAGCAARPRRLPAETAASEEPLRSLTRAKVPMW